MGTGVSKRHHSVFERLRRQLSHNEHPGAILIPLDDLAVYGALASEAAHTVARQPGDRLSVIVDSFTATANHGLDALRAVADRVYLFGAAPPGWDGLDTVISCNCGESVNERDRFLVVYSSSVSLAFLGEVTTGAHHDTTAFAGGWTCQRPFVQQAAQTLLDAGGVTSHEFPAPDPGAAGTCLEHASRLMSVLAHKLTSLERTAEMDKHDLFSVLEILKAISAKRRSHDVLFVFVEQIARVVEMSRCSVVRIWGGEPRGHVLASHDDESINDLAIALEKYPELDRAIQTGGKVVIRDALTDPIMLGLAKDIERTDVRSILVIPIVLHDPNVGSLCLRASRGHKPFTPREVSFCEIVAEAASNALERAHLFESIQRANERLEYLAVTDGLTGLYNHRYFRQRLEQEFERARRYNLPLSCLIFDIDNFKRINDEYGHLQGDFILREMASRTLNATRKSDIVARYGGEEFTVIMPQTGLEGAKAEAIRLLDALRAPPYRSAGNEVRVTVSMGVAVLEHETMLDCEAVIRCADSALYDAKRRGKNQTVVGGEEGVELGRSDGP